MKGKRKIQITQPIKRNVLNFLKSQSYQNGITQGFKTCWVDDFLKAQKRLQAWIINSPKKQGIQIITHFYFYFFTMDIFFNDIYFRPAMKLISML